MARPAHEPTDETRALVRAYAADGVAQPHIAAAIGITDDTLRKYYREELDASKGEWSAKFEQSIKTRVLKDDCPPALVIFTAKTQLGWRELTPKDPDKRNFAELSDDEIASVVGERARERRSRDGSGVGDPASKASAA